MIYGIFLTTDIGGRDKSLLAFATSPRDAEYFMRNKAQELGGVKYWRSIEIPTKTTRIYQFGNHEAFFLVEAYIVESEFLVSRRATYFNMLIPQLRDMGFSFSVGEVPHLFISVQSNAVHGRLYLTTESGFVSVKGCKGSKKTKNTLHFVNTLKKVSSNV